VKRSWAIGPTPTDGTGLRPRVELELQMEKLLRPELKSRGEAKSPHGEAAEGSSRGIPGSGGPAPVPKRGRFDTIHHRPPTPRIRNGALSAGSAVRGRQARREPLAVPCATSRPRPRCHSRSARSCAGADSASWDR